MVLRSQSRMRAAKNHACDRICTSKSRGRGGIGIRSGLKIRLFGLWVRVPPPLPYDCLRARVQLGCGLVSFRCRWGSKLRWNSSCFGSLPAYLGTISPQLRLILPHFSMGKRGCLAHFSMEKRGCLAHFPMETTKWPYTSREGWEAICSDSL